MDEEKTVGQEFTQAWEFVKALFGGEGDHYQDPGEYNPEREDEVRGLMELTSFYDEAGPRSDPAGDYLCGTCSLRQEPDACLFVSGKISMEAGSCDIYVYGDQLNVSLALKEKYSQVASGYVERPDAKGFGCGRCQYGVEAAEPDVDGRTLWCREWGVHVESVACCDRHSGQDMILAPGEESEDGEEEERV